MTKPLTIPTMPCCEHCLVDVTGVCCDVAAGGHLDPCDAPKCTASIMPCGHGFELEDTHGFCRVCGKPSAPTRSAGAASDARHATTLLSVTNRNDHHAAPEADHAS